MSTKVSVRFICVLMCLVFESSSKNLLAADDARTLSQAIDQVKLFKGLTDAERDTLKTVAILRSGIAGERIIEQGKTLDKIIIILEGQAEIWINGKRFVTLDGQTVVGEVEFLDGLPASADVILLKETDLIELTHAALIDLMEKHPRMGYVLMSEIAKIEGRRLRDTNPK
jgi:CRP-like cAMP-binding protein